MTVHSQIRSAHIRRAMALGTIALALGGCFRGVPDPSLSVRDAQFMALVPTAEIDPQFQRYEIDYQTSEKPGTIVVYTADRLLYFVMPGGKAIRYGVGVGNEAFGKPSNPNFLLQPGELLSAAAGLRVVAFEDGFGGGFEGGFEGANVDSFEGATGRFVQRLVAVREPSAASAAGLPPRYVLPA